LSRPGGLRTPQSDRTPAPGVCRGAAARCCWRVRRPSRCAASSTKRRCGAQWKGQPERTRGAVAEGNGTPAVIVADTGAILALLDADDRHHATLRAPLEHDRRAWLLPWAVLPEVDHLALR